MGDQFSKSKYIYESDTAVCYVVGLRDDKAILAGFEEFTDNYVANFPRNWRMRYIVGVSIETGQKIRVCCPTTSCDLWRYKTRFEYLGITYRIEAHVAERRADKY